MSQFTLRTFENSHRLYSAALEGDDSWKSETKIEERILKMLNSLIGFSQLTHAWHRQTPASLPLSCGKE